MTDPDRPEPIPNLISRERAWRDDPTAVVVLLLLTFVAGGTDATTFLFVGGAFVSNQTGTVLLLAMNAGGADVVDTSSAVLSIVGFVLGASAGGRLLSRMKSSERWPPRAVTALWLEAVVLVACVAITWFLDVPPAIVVGLLGLAMGHQAALAARVAMPYLTTGFITGVVAKAAMESPVGDRSRRSWWYVATPVVTIGVGALVTGIVAAEAVPAALALLGVVVVAAAVILSRQENVRVGPRGQSEG